MDNVKDTPVALQHQAIIETKPDSVVLEKRLTALVEGACDILLRVNVGNQILSTSQTTLAAMPMLADIEAPAKLAELIVDEDWGNLRQALHQTRLTATTQKCQARFKAASYRWFELTVLPCATTGTEFEVFVCGRDISEVKAAEVMLEFQGMHDALTGLPNRSALEAQLQARINLCARTAACFTVLVLGLDGMHKANDSQGHAAGDTLLKETARRLSEATGQCYVSRLCGDEFAIILPHTSKAEVDGVIAKLLTTIQQPFTLGGQPLFLTASIGAAVYPDTGSTTHALLSNANLAMHNAKSLGKDRGCLFHDQLRSTAAHTVALESALHQGVRDGEFLLHYQPICAAETGKIMGVEALMRWHRPQQGMVMPSEFIPVVETNGLINVLGAWALKSAASQLCHWDTTGRSGLYASVNVSPRQFRNPNFLTEARKALELSKLDPSRLVLEITEGVLMRDPETACKTLTELVSMGLRISIDDFGTGYSSLAYLQKFPLHTLKIDRSFVQNITTDAKAMAIVSVIIALANETGLTTVAEGVETEEQRAMLAAKGCNYIQGWLTGKPQPAKDLIDRKEYVIS